MKRIPAILLAMLFAMALFTCCTPKAGDTGKPAETTQAPVGALGALTEGIFGIYTIGGTYHVKYVGEMAGGGLTTTEVYAKGGNLALMWPDDPDYNREIIKDGRCYQVNDNQKTVMNMPLDGIAGCPVPPDTAALRYVGSGKADFQGEELDYDEYSHRDGFQAIYFVKDGVLKGIRNAEDGFADVDVEYLVFEKEVPDSVFEIPADYTVSIEDE